MKFACGYVLEFSDDGPALEQVLHVGTREECEKIRERMPVVSYSGGRPVKDAKFVIVMVRDDRAPR